MPDTFTRYRPFCTLACNREYHATVVLSDLTNDRPECLNCGAPVAKWAEWKTRGQRTVER